jgi:putative peptide zinc metalloprotease protein
VHTLSSPQAAARPAPAAPRLEPGTHLAIAMVPEGGATEERPALLVIRGQEGEEPIVLLSDGFTEDGEPVVEGEAAPANGAPATVPAVALPFRLPGDPGPGGTQAVAVGTRDGAVTYNVAYALVTVRDGDPVTNTNSAFAFARCNACTTVAVSLQIVLVIGSSNVIAPINAAGALNVECPACVTAAIARQLVVTLTREPPAELRERLEAALRELDALSSLGPDIAAVLAEVIEIETRIREELEQSGLLARPSPPAAPGTSTSTSSSTDGTTTGPTTTSTSTSTSTGASTTPAATAPVTTTTAPTTTAPPAATTTTTTTAAATTTEEPPPPDDPPPTTTTP